MATAATAGPQPVQWRKVLAPYTRPHIGRSTLDLVTSLVPYLGLQVAMYFLLGVSYWLVLALALPAAGFLLRTYIVFHDCTHGSFVHGKRGNEALGVLTGLFVYANFHSWKHNHAIHHATAGDLDRRGIGDLPTLTLAEYRERSRGARLAYRLFRNPLVMFGLGPFWSLVVQPRLVSRDARPRIRRSVHLTNLALALAIGGLVWAMGPVAFLALQVPMVLLAGAAGIFLFYVQHQFEDVYWASGEQWSYDDAALRGSSYLRLPRVLQFFSGNIGFHHVHHLSSRIPNYNLQRAHDDQPLLRDVPTLSLWDGLRAVRLKLYDPERGRMIGWREARA
jgi:acyl-lipid omega-6 desaturase (Delta-12 desaturase)